MGAFLDKPKTEKELECGNGNGLRFAVCSMQGWRIDMEDAHSALIGLGPPFDHWCFFAIFDGHAGGKVSKHCSEHLIKAIMDTEEFTLLKEEASTPDNPKKQELIRRGLVKGFLNLDEAMRQLPDVQSGEDRSGSTAICAVISPSMVFLANCGDSRGLVVSDGQIKLATRDHKPVNPSEKERIQNAGGSVMIQRVNGSLAVSRALGDYEYKRVEGLGPFQQLISPEPEIFDMSRTDADEFIVLACDGVWDVMTNEEVSEFVRYQLTVSDNLENICQNLVDTCLNRGSRDNISIVLIALPGAPKVSEEAQKAEEELDRKIEQSVKEILDQCPEATATEMDMATLMHLVTMNLNCDYNWPPVGGINAKRSLIERVWRELRPNQELKQDAGRPSAQTLMNFLHAKHISKPTGQSGEALESGGDRSNASNRVDGHDLLNMPE